MKLWLATLFCVLVVFSALLMWSSHSFDQDTAYQFPFYAGDNTAQVILPLPMTFAHADHAKQQCVACHHNYQDETGQGLCLDCHRNDQEIAFKMRDQFHGLCMGCHMDKRTENERSGPLRHCAACHTKDLAP